MVSLVVPVGHTGDRCWPPFQSVGCWTYGRGFNGARDRENSQSIASSGGDASASGQPIFALVYWGFAGRRLRGYRGGHADVRDQYRVGKTQCGDTESDDVRAASFTRWPLVPCFSWCIPHLLSKGWTFCSKTRFVLRPCRCIFPSRAAAIWQLVDRERIEYPAPRSRLLGLGTSCGSLWQCVVTESGRAVSGAD